MKNQTPLIKETVIHQLANVINNLVWVMDALKDDDPLIVEELAKPIKELCEAFNEFRSEKILHLTKMSFFNLVQKQSALDHLCDLFIEKYSQGKEDTSKFNLLRASLAAIRNTIVFFKNLAEGITKRSLLSVADFMKGAVGENPRVSLFLSPEVYKKHLLIPTGSLQTALDAVISNAVYAVKDVTKPEILISVTTEEANLIITVADNGIGIPPSIRSKIFKRGFTTKETDNGTGLGLHCAKIVMELLKGDLVLLNTSKTIFKFSIPLVQEELTAEKCKLTVTLKGITDTESVVEVSKKGTEIFIKAAQNAPKSSKDLALTSHSEVCFPESLKLFVKEVEHHFVSGGLPQTFSFTYQKAEGLLDWINLKSVLNLILKDDTTKSFLMSIEALDEENQINDFSITFDVTTI